MIYYGLDIPNESSFWDEVKLRAINNYGDCGSKGVDAAIEAITDDLCAVIKSSKEAKQVKREIEQNQA